MMTQLQDERTRAIRKYARLRHQGSEYAAAVLHRNVCDCRTYRHFHQAGAGKCPQSRWHFEIDTEAG